MKAAAEIATTVIVKMMVAGMIARLDHTHDCDPLARLYLTRLRLWSAQADRIQDRGERTRIPTIGYFGLLVLELVA